MVTTHATPENPRIIAIKRLHHLPTAQALLLDALLDGEVISQKFMIEVGIAPTETTARSVVYRLRKYLRTREIEIESHYSTGYWLEKEPREKLVAELDGFLPGGVNGNR